MPGIGAEYCRRQAARMHALAEQCTDRNIRDQVEAMAKTWTDKAVAREGRRKLISNEYALHNPASATALGNPGRESSIPRVSIIQKRFSGM